MLKAEFQSNFCAILYAGETKIMVWLDSCGWIHGTVAGSCEYINKVMGYKQGGWHNGPDEWQQGDEILISITNTVIA